MKLLPKINTTVLSLRVLYFSFMTALIVLIAAILVYQQNSLENVIQAEQKRTLNIVKDLINDKVLTYTQDATYLANEEHVLKYLQNQDDESTLSVQNEFINFARSHPNIEQIRILDAEGNEKIKIISRDEIVSIVPTDNLQNKKDRYYFRETFSLGIGEVYISKLDLNEEFGYVELPQRPMIRVSTPTYVNGEKTGILIININGREILDVLTSVEGGGTSFYLANEDGYWLKYKDSSLEWSFMYEGDHSTKLMSYSSPEAWKQIQNNALNISTFTDSGIYITTTALSQFPKNIVPTENWYIVSFVTNEEYSNYILYIKTLIILVLIFISVAISFLFYNLIQLLTENHSLKRSREKYLKTQHKHLEVLTSTMDTVLNAIEKRIKSLHENNIVNEWTESIQKQVEYGSTFNKKTQEYSLHQTTKEEEQRETSLRNFFRELTRSYTSSFKIEGDALINSTLAIETAFVHILSYLFIYANVNSISIAITQSRQGIEILLSGDSKSTDLTANPIVENPKELSFAKSIIEKENGEILVSHSQQHIAIKIRIGGI